MPKPPTGVASPLHSNKLCGGRAYPVDITSARACADLIHAHKRVDILTNK